MVKYLVTKSLEWHKDILKAEGKKLLEGQARERRGRIHNGSGSYHKIEIKFQEVPFSCETRAIYMAYKCGQTCGEIYY